MGTCSVAGYLVPARPGDLPFRMSQHAFAPGEPAIVRRQPSMSRRYVTLVKAEVGSEALEEEPLLVDQVARFSL